MNETISKLTEFEKVLNVLEDREFIVSDTALRLLQIVLSGIIQGALSLTGVVFNVFNLIIFVKLGLSNSTNVSIFVMSFSDCIFSLLQLTISCCHLAEEFQLHLEFNLRDFSLFVIGNIECIVYFVSCWVTAFISIERCVCVIFPFKVRVIFTTRRSVIAMSIIYLVAITTNLHMLYGLELQPREVSSNSNSSISTKYHWTMVYFTVAESKVWGFIEYVFSGIVTFVSCQILLLLCSILMTCGLHRNTRIRVHHPRFNNGTSTYQKVDNPRSNLSRSEQKLVKVVLSLSVLTIVCNIPKTIAYVVYYIKPEYQLDVYPNVNVLMWEIALFSSTFIPLGNFCIYMKLNKKYRTIFHRLLSH